MLGDIRQAQQVYIVCGYTDMRKGINSLAPYIQKNFQMDPYSSGLFLFCGKRCDRQHDVAMPVLPLRYIPVRLEISSDLS